MAFNRTLEELKLYYRQLEQQKYAAFNRTLEELKSRCISGAIIGANRTFNRTLEELKYQHDDYADTLHISFNRTLEELKLLGGQSGHPRKSCLLIEP